MILTTYMKDSFKVSFDVNSVTGVINATQIMHKAKPI